MGDRLDRLQIIVKKKGLIDPFLRLLDGQDGHPATRALGTDYSILLAVTTSFFFFLFLFH